MRIQPTSKKIRRTTFGGTFAVITAAVLLAGPVVAETKKDISDPVLQEIVQSFAGKMPRFIDKHGLSIFVADEPITRGSLMHALYEYDKSLNRQPKKEYVLKQEFDEFRNKLALRQEKMTAASEKFDISTVINELQPNMGVLLDSSLASSKVFMSLKNTIESSRGEGVSQADSDIVARTQAEMSDLTRRVEGIEKLARIGDGESAPAIRGDKGISKQEYREMRDKLTQIEGAQVKAVSRSEINDLRARIDEIERAGSVGKTARGETREYKELRDKLAQIEGAQSNTVPRSEISDLRNRIDEVERVAAGGKAARGENRGTTHQDVTLLERRLENLETRMKEDGKGAGKDLAARKEIEDLRARLDGIERDSGEADSGEVRKSNAEMRREIVRLNKRLDAMERSGSVTGSGTPGELRQYASGLTKLTLSLGMVAAFFIAR